MAVLSLVAMLLLTPVAFAQEEEASEEVETPEGGEAEIEAKGPPEVVKPAVNKPRKRLRPSPVLKEPP